ncbi:MAG: hypothetical protein OK439_01730 [Thaumarchaeota archaeon]|nr:hypothetical protein [Nitrososphaerota archaeon]
MIFPLSILKSVFLQTPANLGPVIALIVAIAIAGIAIIIVSVKRK